MFPSELEGGSFKASNGEYGWTRAQIPAVVEILVEHGMAILGGELWWVLDGAGTWNGLIPQRKGLDAVYHWETLRRSVESWSDFVNRCAADTLAAVVDLPAPGELPEELPGRVLYNLTWVSEVEYAELGSRAV